MHPASSFDCSMAAATMRAGPIPYEPMTIGRSTPPSSR